MSKPVHFHEPAFPVAQEINGNGDVVQYGYTGLSQYAYVAMIFHAALLTSDGLSPEIASSRAFNHADAFFAELANRTK